MTHELAKRFRPKSVKTVLGQEEAVAKINGFIKRGEVPHAVLFSGPSGCGKTTLARILRKAVDCHDSNFYEVNAADYRGIDTVRDIRSRMTLASVGGKARVWLLDEAHGLSSDAQDALLKILEDTPPHVYFFLASTNPEKLKPTVRTRCVDVRVKAVSAKVLTGLVLDVAGKVEKELSEEVVEKIVECADGSARAALNSLEAILGLENEGEQLDAVCKGNVKAQAFDIVKALLWQKANWPALAKLLQGLEVGEHERLRHYVLTVANGELLKGHKAAGRAFLIIQAFRDPWYSCPQAGLAAACYEVISQ